MSTKNAGNAKHAQGSARNTGRTRSGAGTSRSDSARGTGSRPERAGRSAGTGRSGGAGRSASGMRSTDAGHSGQVRTAGNRAGGAGRSAGTGRSGGTGRSSRPGSVSSSADMRRASGKKNMSAKKKAARRRKRTMLFVAEILILVVMLGFLYTVLKTEKVERIQIDEERVVMEMNENVETNEVMKGYRNIAMFGVDSREGALGKGTRSDTIIIASINLDTGDVKLVSVFRDTYLNLGNDQYNKCNAAYAKGGPEQAITMLNKNLDMNITDYITVGFDGLIEVIDALGGVEIDVKQSEIEHLNNYQISMVGREVGRDGDIVHYEATEGKDYTKVTQAGMQTLNGLQATAYCRIRYVGNDFERAQRQRRVIAAVSEKAKHASVSELNDIVNGVMNNVSTSLDVKEILSVLSDLGNYSVVADDGFPFEQYRTTGRVGSKGSCVIPQDLASNVVELHRFLFDEDDYQISSEVEEFSKKVANDTGKYVNTAAEEFSKKDGDEVAGAGE